MSVIELPVRPRGPSPVNAEPAQVIRHPSAKEPEPVLDTYERAMQELWTLDARMKADMDMATLFRELETFVFRLAVTAMAHGRAQQAVHMMHAALVNIKSQVKV